MHLNDPKCTNQSLYPEHDSPWPQFVWPQPHLWDFPLLCCCCFICVPLVICIYLHHGRPSIKFIREQYRYNPASACCMHHVANMFTLDLWWLVRAWVCMQLVGTVHCKFICACASCVVFNTTSIGLRQSASDLKLNASPIVLCNRSCKVANPWNGRVTIINGPFDYNKHLWYPTWICQQPFAFRHFSRNRTSATAFQLARPPEWNRRTWSDERRLWMETVFVVTPADWLLSLLGMLWWNDD